MNQPVVDCHVLRVAIKHSLGRSRVPAYQASVCSHTRTVQTLRVATPGVVIFIKIFYDGERYRRVQGAMEFIGVNAPELAPKLLASGWSCKRRAGYLAMTPLGDASAAEYFRCATRSAARRAALETGRALARLHSLASSARTSNAVPIVGSGVANAELEAFLQHLVVLEKALGERQHEKALNDICMVRANAKGLGEAMARVDGYNGLRVLIHGDLWSPNLRYDRASSEEPFVGFLDWDGLCIGDPHIDLVRLYSRGFREEEAMSASGLRPPDRALWDAILEGYEERGTTIDLDAEVRSVYSMYLVVRSISWHGRRLAEGRPLASERVFFLIHCLVDLMRQRGTCSEGQAREHP